VVCQGACDRPTTLLAFVDVGSCLSYCGIIDRMGYSDYDVRGFATTEGMIDWIYDNLGLADHMINFNRTFNVLPANPHRVTYEVSLACSYSLLMSLAIIILCMHGVDDRYRYGVTGQVKKFVQQHCNYKWIHQY
jgi:hypothetical protein